MRFQYAEKKVNLPENVHKYAEKKVMKLERFFGDDADALVTFSVEKDRNKVEITVHAANTYFRASESTSDMFASVDAAVATIERQIRKNKTRLARRLRQDAFVRTPDVTSFAPEEPEEVTLEEAVDRACRLAEAGAKQTDAAKQIAAETGFKKSEIYAAMLQR